ncbi:hypothetical protein TcasGA2_TC007217 [Tribolium castaneum]|uniref:Uncharacterized protein n=1 Tax=Tribolium castaneum TaxID=7070 RepID=D2A0R7_TRICA|nr:hypothetical protein TcasGA2_TC007217 [Tribolium castaneum]
MARREFSSWEKPSTCTVNPLLLLTNREQWNQLEAWNLLWSRRRGQVQKIDTKDAYMQHEFSSGQKHSLFHTARSHIQIPLPDLSTRFRTKNGNYFNIASRISLATDLVCISTMTRRNRKLFPP